MTFEEDLTKRRIDVAAFAAGDPAKFAEWQQMYAQMHPNSFYISVKMVLNDVRRKFWLAEAVKPAVTVTAVAPAKPAARRAAIPGAAKPPTEIPVPTVPIEQPESKPAPPVRGRAIIRKASASPGETGVPEGTPVTSPEIPADAAAVSPDIPSENPPANPIPAPRPRPVFRKSTPAATSTEKPVSPEQIAQDNTNQATPFHTNPDPEAETLTETPTEMPATKPAPRPRPVIKRPSVAANTADEPVPGDMPQEVKPENSTPAAAPVTNSELKPATPRPRPVIRRPNPPADEVKLSAPAVTEEPAGAEQVQEEPPQEPGTTVKPPRPRPVFKRPSKPEDNPNP